MRDPTSIIPRSISFRNPSALLAKTLRWLTGLAVLNGIGLCVIHYLSFRSLWLDEAFVAVNVRERSLDGLFKILDYSQLFPRLYLSAVWMLQHVFGYELWTLRLLPCLFGVTAVIFWSRILWKEFGNAHFNVPASCAVLVFLSSWFPYYYAGELKQYSAELFFSAYGVWYFKKFLRPVFRARWTSWAFWSMGWVWPVLVSFNYPFVLVAGGLTLMIEQKPPFSRTWFSKLVILLGFGFIMLWISWVIDLRFLSQEGFYEYWKPLFVNGATMTEWARSAAKGLNRILGDWWITRSAAVLLSPLAWAGLYRIAWGLFRRRPCPPLGLMGGIIFMMMFVFAVFQKYALEAGRTGLFFFPFVAAFIGYGLSLFMDSPSHVVQKVGQLMAFLVLVLTLIRKLPAADRHFYRESHWEDINPAIQLLNSSRSSTVVYGMASVCQVKAYPHLPKSFHFSSQDDFLAHLSSGRVPSLLESGFYYLMATPDGGPDRMDQALQSLWPHNRQQLDPHLFFFEPRAKSA